MISIIMTLILAGLLLYLISLLPLDPTVKQIIHVVAIVFIILWVIQALGLMSGFPSPGVLK